MMESQQDKKNRRLALLGTVGVHGLALFLFLIFGFRTPLPLPAESGIAVNFGYDEDGFGKEEVDKSGSNDQNEEESASNSANNQRANQPLQQTQDFEEAPAVNKGKTNSQQTTPTTSEQAIEKPVETPQKTVNPKALYPGKTSGGSGGSQGTTSGTGNQGNPDGDKNSPRQGEGGQGGEAGSPDYKLDGRAFTKRPTVNDRSQTSGKIIVYIWVNPDGEVTRCKAGAKGTTIMNTELWEKCEAAALQARFSPAENAPAEQQGTLTFIFTLQ
jgi:hypothetical protein